MAKGELRYSIRFCASPATLELLLRLAGVMVRLGHVYRVAFSRMLDTHGWHKCYKSNTILSVRQYDFGRSTGSVLPLPMLFLVFKLSGLTPFPP